MANCKSLSISWISPAAPLATITELAIELLAVLPDGPEVLGRLPLPRRWFVVGRVEGLVAHRRSFNWPSATARPRLHREGART
jgi:hypothetical protein